MGALAELSARDREVLVMRHLERLRSSEIAEALGITEGAVESRLLRALMRFRGLLEADQ
jgi:RNA polymerase sigma-70 factor (ECF subfamily)